MPVLFPALRPERNLEEAYDENRRCGMAWRRAPGIPAHNSRVNKRSVGQGTCGRTESLTVSRPLGTIPFPLWPDPGHQSRGKMLRSRCRTGRIGTGVAWCRLYEAYEVGWADICNYGFSTTHRLPGVGFLFLPTATAGAKVPPHLQEVCSVCPLISRITYRQVWYWVARADLRVNGDKRETDHQYRPRMGGRS